MTMNELFAQLLADPWGRLLIRFAVQGGAEHAWLFLMVAGRLAGVFLVAPLLMKTSIPFIVRMGLVVFLSLQITPVLSLAGPDAPEIELIGYVSSLDGNLLVALTELICLIANEVGLGTSMGVGGMAILGGLWLAGEFLDRHCGLGMGAVYNPEWSSGESPGGTLIHLLGIASFLLIEPLGGSEQILHCLIQSFRSIPVGFGAWSQSAMEMIGSVVQFSLLFAIRIALPIIATMILIDLTLAFANRSASSPANTSQLVIRASTGLALLTCSTAAIPDLMAAATMVVVRLVIGG